jgi:hypothetical protein
MSANTVNTPRAPNPVTFVGGIGSPMGWHFSAPMGRLAFDEQRLVISGVGPAATAGTVDMLRQEVAAVRLSTGVLAVRVSVIDLNGNALVPFFTAVSRRRIRMALRDRTWVVEDTYLLRQKRLWTGP